MMSGQLFTVKEVAERLRVSESWLYRKCRAKVLPHIRIGGVIRVPEGDLAKWLKDHSITGSLKI